MAARVLLHICCGPCALAPVLRLKEAGWLVTGLFYNPNIQPAAEYLRRRDALAEAASRLEIEVLYGDYDPIPHLRRSLADPENRCAPCTDERLARTAVTARTLGCDAFSTTLLYSRYQDHEGIKAQGEARSAALGLPFLYEDFRVLWDEGVALSREWGLYRQPYCGCVLSELDRYAKKLARPPAVPPR
jgi:predicted adenine nucleotide alpha hydrolase (AANH) superfamily ATPase